MLPYALAYISPDAISTLQMKGHKVYVIHPSIKSTAYSIIGVAFESREFRSILFEGVRFGQPSTGQVGSLSQPAQSFSEQHVADMNVPSPFQHSVQNGLNHALMRFVHPPFLPLSQFVPPPFLPRVSSPPRTRNIWKASPAPTVHKAICFGRFPSPSTPAVSSPTIREVSLPAPLRPAPMPSSSNSTTALPKDTRGTPSSEPVVLKSVPQNGPDLQLQSVPNENPRTPPSKPAFLRSVSQNGPQSLPKETRAIQSSEPTVLKSISQNGPHLPPQLLPKEKRGVPSSEPAISKSISQNGPHLQLPPVLKERNVDASCQRRTRSMSTEKRDKATEAYRKHRKMDGIKEKQENADLLRRSKRILQAPFRPLIRILLRERACGRNSTPISVLKMVIGVAYPTALSDAGAEDIRSYAVLADEAAIVFFSDAPWQSEQGWVSLRDPQNYADAVQTNALLPPQMSHKQVKNEKLANAAEHFIISCVRSGLVNNVAEKDKLTKDGVTILLEGLVSNLRNLQSGQALRKYTGAQGGTENLDWTGRLWNTFGGDGRLLSTLFESAEVSNIVRSTSVAGKFELHPDFSAS